MGDFMLSLLIFTGDTDSERDGDEPVELYRSKEGVL
jgi:hypothetical protein